MAKRRKRHQTFHFADGRVEFGESPPEELTDEWALEFAGWSKSEISQMSPDDKKLQVLSDKTKFANSVQQGLQKFIDRGIWQGDFRNHVAWQRLDDSFTRLNEKYKPNIDKLKPSEPPKPIRFSAIKFTTARGNVKTEPGQLAKYRYIYEVTTLDVSFGREGTHKVQGKRIVGKEFLGFTDVFSPEITPETLTKSSKKVWKMNTYQLYN